MKSYCVTFNVTCRNKEHKALLQRLVLEARFYSIGKTAAASILEAALSQYIEGRKRSQDDLIRFDIKEAV